jgi:hypothetical protein
MENMSMSVKSHTRKLDEQPVVIAESELRSLIEVTRHISPVKVEEALPNADCGWITP